VYVAAGEKPVLAAASVATGQLTPFTKMVVLDSTAAGVRRLRLSPAMTFGDATDTFLYAFVGDGSVHVVLAQQETVGGRSDELAECETNPDPRQWVDWHGVPPAGLDWGIRACVRLDAEPRPPRAPLRRTPGIRPPGGVAKDVAFWTISEPQIASREDQEPGPANLVGTFGWLAQSRGTGAVLNLVPDVNAGQGGGAGNPYDLRPDPSLILAHQVRSFADISLEVSGTSVVSMGQNTGPPRVFQLIRTADGIAYSRRDAFRVDDAHLSDGTVAQALDEVRSTSRSFYDVFFPDVQAVRAESWSFTLNGALPYSVRASGNIDWSGTVLEDRGQVFCQLGVQPGDLLNLSGCVFDTQCGPGEICVTDPTAAANVTGLCLPKDQAESLRATCASYLRSLRQYRVLRAFADRVELAPSFEIRHLPGGCDPALGDVETDRCNAPAPTDLPELDPTTRHYVCDAVSWHAGGECVRDCEEDRLCGDGYLCDPATRRCLAGPLPTGPSPGEKNACFAELLPYSFQAGDGFTVYGNASGAPVTGLLHRIVPSPTPDGALECVDELALTTDPEERGRLALMQGRIPLLPPPCANRPPDEWPPQPNPCRVDGAAEQYYFDEGQGTLLDDGRAVKVYFANPVLNAGFLIGRLTDEGALEVNPPPSSNYMIQADVGGFYQPLTVTLASFLPETLLTGPDGYIYVVDSGLDVTTSGYRGQLLRLDPASGGIDSTFVVR
jgi:hypothetical protein